MQRYRVTVIAHRRCPAGTRPWAGGSGIVHLETVRAQDAAFARDLVLLHVHTGSALVSEAPVGVDAVVVERLRRLRRPVREIDSRRRPEPAWRC